MAARAFIAAFATVLFVGSTGLGQTINLSNGSTSYSWDSDTGTATYSDSRYGGSNVLSDELWLIRYEDFFGGGTEFVNLNQNESNVSIDFGMSSASSITFNVAGSSGDPAVNVTLNFSMDSDGKVSYDFSISDQDFFPTAHTISLFNYFDVNLSAGADNAMGSATEILQTQSQRSFRKVAVDADNFQVGAPFDIENSLTSDVNFNLSGNTAASGNVAGAFQWDHDIPDNGTYSASGFFAVPEPAMGGLGVLMVAGIGLVRRRKR